jgi:hypothetical protein
MASAGVVEILDTATVLQQGKPCVLLPNVRRGWIVASSERWTLLAVLLGQEQRLIDHRL